MEDDTHHNLWECDAALLSSTCRKLKQLIFEFISSKSAISIRELNEQTSLRTESGITLLLLNVNSINLNARFKTFKENLSNQENTSFQLLAQKYVHYCDLIRNRLRQIIKDGGSRPRPRTFKTTTRRLRMPAQRAGHSKAAGKTNNNKKTAQSSNIQKTKNNNLQEQLVMLLVNPGVLISEMSMYTGCPDGPDGIKHKKTVEHRGGVTRSSELPQLNTILRVHVTASDKDIVTNFKTYTCWCKLRDLRDMLKVYNFLCHPDLLKHTSFRDLDKLIPFSILTTETTDRRPVAIKLIKQNAMETQSSCIPAKMK